MDNANIELIRSHMDTIILRTLQNDDKYGLEILNEIRNLSNELYSIKQPTLYSSLKRLESQGLILSYPGEETKGANRTYYRLTDEGKEFLQADQKQWEFSRTIIDKLLSDKEFDREHDDKPFDPSDFRPLTKRSKKENVEPQVVVKYVEVEKPIYIDRNTGNIINDYSSNENSNAIIEEKENSSQNQQQNQNAKFDQESNSEIKENDTYQPTNYDFPYDIKDNFVKETTQTDDSTNVNSYDEVKTEEKQKPSPLDNYFISNQPIDFGDSNKNPASTSIENKDNASSAYIDDNVDYINLFSGKFNSDKKESSTENINSEVDNQTNQYQFDDYSELTMNDLQKTFVAKNIKLKPYLKTNTIEFYSGKFYYANKVLRDWSIITYAIFAVFLLISYFASPKNALNLGWTLGFIFIATLLPIICTIICIKAPERKMRTNFNFNNALLASIILMIALALVILVVGFFIVQVSFDEQRLIPVIIIPIVSLLMLPISVIVYTLIYNLKKYRLG